MRKENVSGHFAAALPAGVARIAETIMDQSHRSRMRFLNLRPTPTKSVEEHQLIIDAIRKGLPLEAHNHARAHRRMRSKSLVRARPSLSPRLSSFVWLNPNQLSAYFSFAEKLSPPVSGSPVLR
jgi:hypothetical protein